MKRTGGFILGIFFTLAAQAQVFHVSQHSVYLTGAACSVDFMDAFSFTANPAVLGIAKQNLGALSVENKWMLKELAYDQGAFVLPTGSGGIGFHFHFAGNADDQESGIALGYGRNLGRISLGLQLGVDEEHISFYGNRYYASWMLGLRFHPAEKIYAGLALDNAVSGKTDQANAESGPGDFRLAFGYQVSDGVFIGLQVVKAWGVPLNVIASLDYRFAASFFASAGIETGNASPYIKAGWKKNQLRIDLFTSYHATLGFTPGLAILWEGKKKPA